MNNEFAGKPFQLTVIDGSYAVMGCTRMGAVLMALWFPGWTGKTV